MKSRLKILGIAVAAAMCAAPMVGPGVAQENAQASDASKAGSGAGPGGSGAINSGADAKSSDGGDRGAGQGRLREGDAVRSGSPVQAGPGSDANRKGVRAPAGGVSTPPGQQDVTLDRGINPVRLEGGLAGLQRRANRKLLIANAPPAGPSARIGADPPFTRPGADGGAVRNAVGVAVQGGGQGSSPGFAARTGIGASGPGSGAIGVGTAAGNISGLQRPTIPSNAVVDPAPHAAGINGTTMSHIASGPGSIGGPAKDRSGINGTAMRPKR